MEMEMEMGGIDELLGYVGVEKESRSCVMCLEICRRGWVGR